MVKQLAMSLVLQRAATNENKEHQLIMSKNEWQCLVIYSKLNFLKNIMALLQFL